MKLWKESREGKRRSSSDVCGIHTNGFSEQLGQFLVRLRV